ncbi:exonuclease SbcCD subunit D [Butyrivibrio sp. WCD3002]|uniref:exonuclease SbcCD subunit D n=1 Tax=Butyrivibrio sp. WCD3002 TaxID=1280676 RepID=UPI0005661CA6|nr:exonuclease SbcCD subunit D [Butyrivibrio sp. WCD3002]
MKFLHLGDLHLGKSLGEFDLIEDQRYILDRIIDIAKEKKADAILIAGDVYDRAIPSEAAVGLLDSFFCSLSENNIKVFVISGNHDSDERLGFGSALFEESGIYICSKFDGHLYRHVFTDSVGDVNIYLLPFIKASQVRHFFPDEKIETYDDAVKCVLEHSDFNKDERNVLVAHQFVAGGADPVLAGSEHIQALSVGTVERISYSTMENFDYVALGHIHSPQKVGHEHIRYSGSPIKYSLSEVSNDKSVPFVTVGEKGELDIELIPLKPKRDLRRIKGELKQLLSSENVTDTEDFIYAVLTDENIVNDAMSIFQQYYPNTVKIEYDNEHTRSIEHVDPTDFTEKRSFTDLISDFYRQVYGCEITEDELLIMKEVGREAGVVDEAD